MGTLNITLLTEIRDLIDAHPESFYMDLMEVQRDQLITRLDAHELYWEDEPLVTESCGTACCIAGWALALTEGHKPGEDFTLLGNGDLLEKAARLLGATDDDEEFALDALFHYKTNYQSPARAVVDYLCSTEGADFEMLQNILGEYRLADKLVRLMDDVNNYADYRVQAFQYIKEVLCQN